MSDPARLSTAYLDLVGRALINDIHPDAGFRVVTLVRELLQALGRPDDWNSVEAEIARVFSIHPLLDRFEPSNWYYNVGGDPFTMVSPSALENVRTATETVLREGVPGDLIETGVWRGGLCIMMKAVLMAAGSSRRVFVCDSFQGLPEVSEGVDAPLQLHDRPLLAISVDKVRENFSRFGLLDENVRFVEGWFADTMPKLRDEIDQIAVLRLDGDYYTSTREVIDPLYDKVAPGGFIIVDDYGIYDQARDAIHDFWSDRGLSPDLIQVDASCHYWRKPKS